MVFPKTELRRISVSCGSQKSYPELVSSQAGFASMNSLGFLRAVESKGSISKRQKKIS
jgi:hypothetical protein